MKVCFVVSPIGEEGSEIRINADKLFKHIIKPVCEACNFNPIRVDQLNDSNSISQTIIEHLDSDDLVIADITGHNPNVFYEMGYRTKTKKPMIHLKCKDEKLPFDVNAIRTFDYDLTDLDSVEELKDRLQKTIESFVFSSDDEEVQLENSTENNSAAIMQVLYQILDTMGELKSEVKNFTTDTISTVVKSMQPSQPQLPPDTALQMQLMNGFLQNPEGFMKLIELSEKAKTYDSPAVKSIFALLSQKVTKADLPYQKVIYPHPYTAGKPHISDSCFCVCCTRTDIALSRKGALMSFFFGIFYVNCNKTRTRNTAH